MSRTTSAASLVDVRNRVEYDALGAVEVPMDALYGPRTERARRLRVSTSTLGDRPEVLLALAEVKQAAAIANRLAGTLDPEVAGAVERAAQLVASGTIDESHFPVDPLLGGGWVAVNANLNEVLAALASSSPDGLGAETYPGGGFAHPTGQVTSDRDVSPADVNRSQSTADVCHTAVRVAVFRIAEDLHREAVRLADSLEASAGLAADVTTLSRTCLQDALPVSAGQRLHGSAAAARRAVADLHAAIQPLLSVTLGGTVVGDGAGADDDYRAAVVPALANVTGLSLQAHPSPATAMQHSDDLLAVSSSTDRLARAASKLAADLRLLSSGPTGGFGEIRLPHVLDGSTYFTDKRNPIVPETMINAAIEVASHHHAVQAVTERAELDLNVFDGLAALHVLDALETLHRAILLLRSKAIDGLVVDRDRCEHLARSGLDLEESRP